ncbi:hypothetical protein RB195_009427 [Necator americanus]|uniref:PAN domain protein n=1 Tax=Necator americanus TaxID=51031 RepID=A0ABR1CT98_NECAM
MVVVNEPTGDNPGISSLTSVTIFTMGRSCRHFRVRQLFLSLAERITKRRETALLHALDAQMNCQPGCIISLAHPGIVYEFTDQECTSPAHQQHASAIPSSSHSPLCRARVIIDAARSSSSSTGGLGWPAGWGLGPGRLARRGLACRYGPPRASSGTATSHVMTS